LIFLRQIVILAKRKTDKGREVIRNQHVTNRLSKPDRNVRIITLYVVATYVLNSLFSRSISISPSADLCLHPGLIQMSRVYSLTLANISKCSPSPFLGTPGLGSQRLSQSVYLRWDKQYGSCRRQPTANDLINTSIGLPHPSLKGG
jgi:hypothetical protein